MPPISWAFPSVPCATSSRNIPTQGSASPIMASSARPKRWRDRAMLRTLLTGLFFLAAGNALARDIPVPKAQGYDLSGLGERVEINQLFQAPDGHLIVKFSYHDQGQ